MHEKSDAFSFRWVEKNSSYLKLSSTYLEKTIVARLFYYFAQRYKTRKTTPELEKEVLDLIIKSDNEINATIKKTKTMRNNSILNFLTKSFHVNK